MSEKIPIRKDANLLVKAKAIFGDDLVTGAFVCTWEESDARKVSARLNGERHHSPELDSRGLSYDSQHIRLIFCNGRTVDFENSEWASISTPNGDSYEA